MLPIDFLPWGLLLAVLALYLIGVLALVASGRRTAARSLAGFVPDCALMVKRLLSDPAISIGQRVALAALALYLVSPIDLVPDFIPVAGQLDDAILITLVLRWLLRMHGEAAIRAAWPGPQSSLAIVLRAVRGGSLQRRHYAYPVGILEQVQTDTREAMKAGDRDRVGALRMVTDALQKDAKEGGDDAVAVLRRERKRRLEAAEAYREGGSADRAKAEEAEAKVIESYLPAELGDEELAALVDEAIAESGASDPADMGKAMGAAMPKVGGRADGKRVSAMVRERLGS